MRILFFFSWSWMILIAADGWTDNIWCITQCWTSSSASETDALSRDWGKKKRKVGWKLLTPFISILFLLLRPRIHPILPFFFFFFLAYCTIQPLSILLFRGGKRRVVRLMNMIMGAEKESVWSVGEKRWRFPHTGKKNRDRKNRASRLLLWLFWSHLKKKKKKSASSSFSRLAHCVNCEQPNWGKWAHTGALSVPSVLQSSVHLHT